MPPIIIDCFSFTPSVQEHSANVTIKCPTKPEPTWLMLPVNRAEELVHEIGKVRQSMSPSVPEEVPPGALIEVVSNSSFGVWSNPVNEQLLVMSVRDPRFGWLYYNLSRDAAIALAMNLKQAAETPPPAPPKAN